jgi:hypothetical protein
MYSPSASTNVDLPTPGGPATPNRNDDVVDDTSSRAVLIVDCRSLSNRTSAIKRRFGDLLSTSVIALDRAILCCILLSSSDELSLDRSDRYKISSAKDSIVFSSSFVKDFNDCKYEYFDAEAEVSGFIVANRRLLKTCCLGT